MSTFHADPALKQSLLVRIGAHEQADAIARGAYEKWNGGVHRCAVGCSVRDLNDRSDEPADWHYEMERLTGIPVWLCRLEDRVFEGMPAKDAKGWPRRFAEAVPVGRSLDGLADRLAIRRLREECLPLSGNWPESVRGEVVAAIEQVIVALDGKGDRSAARSAAYSAYAAARSAADSAARSAAYSARSAAYSAYSADSATYSAADSAAYLRESHRIVAETRGARMTTPRPGTAADRALHYITTHPGATFTEIHRATNPHARSNAATTRATDRLLHSGLIRKERDGQRVRHRATASGALAARLNGHG